MASRPLTAYTTSIPWRSNSPDGKDAADVVVHDENLTFRKRKCPALLIEGIALLSGEIRPQTVQEQRRPSNRRSGETKRPGTIPAICLVHFSLFAYPLFRYRRRSEIRCIRISLFIWAMFEARMSGNPRSKPCSQSAEPPRRASSVCGRVVTAVVRTSSCPISSTMA